MRILIFHGYLLRGTGSNIYNANLARALRKLGHEVHLFCQDGAPAELGWVDAIGGWGSDGLEIIDLGREPGIGSVTVYRPPIGQILPVYVEDPYEDFEARAYPGLTDEVIERYVEVNVDAVRDVLMEVGPPDVALANHLIMGPVILRRAGLDGYVVKNHGSDLEYTIKPHPRFVPWAAEGLAAASAVLVGSAHTARSLWAAIPGLDLEAVTGLGPPGVEPEEFLPIEPPEARGRLLGLADRLRDLGSEGRGPMGRDPIRAAEALDRMADAEGPRVAFVGKLIVSKGVDLLVAAWPLVHRDNPGAELVIAGFGEYAESLEDLIGALGEGDLGAALEIAGRGRAAEGGDPDPLAILTGFLSDHPEGYRQDAIDSAGTIHLTGRLEHDEVAGLLPACDAMVVPSTFPEAFGMVAAEGAISGILPVCARHSGLAEVTAVLADDVPEIADLISFEVGPGAVGEIASCLNGWLEIERGERVSLGRSLSESADRHWSWEGVARDLIAASRGELRPVVTDR
jgi:glycosyltransferase involved in cell wall biosynthesis